MRVFPLRTRVVQPGDDLIALLDAYLPPLAEGSVLAISSKVVAICQNRLITPPLPPLDDLIARESEYFLPTHAHPFGVGLAVVEGMLVTNAGIDASNGDGSYVLWPAQPQTVVNTVRRHVAQRFGLTRLGVILTDSKLTPLRWGVTALALAHSGFAALRDYIGQHDIFGQPLRMTKVNVSDSLATAAAFVMGEGSEQQPFAVIEAAPDLIFQDRDPSAEELAQLRIALGDDIFAPLLQAVAWQRGQRSSGDPQV